MRPVSDPTSRTPSETDDCCLWTGPQRSEPAATPSVSQAPAAEVDCLECSPAAASDRRCAPAASPAAPRPPFDRTTPTVGLSGEALERAEAHNDECWRGYAADYLAYLERTRDAFQGAPTLEALRAVDPEPPTDVLPRIGQADLWERLDRAYRNSLEAKVDRGYALLGSTPPGTLQSVLSASFRAGSVQGAAGVTVAADGPNQTSVRASLGGVEATRVTRIDGADRPAGTVQQTAGVRIDGAFGVARVDSNGNAEIAAKVGPARVATNTRGDLQVEFKAAGVLGGSATYRRDSASFGGGVSIGAGVPGLEAKVSAEAQMRGLSEDDVRRALTGWLVADREPEAEGWLREQRALAALSR